MIHNEIFGSAKWIMPEEDTTSAIFRGTFNIDNADLPTEINICGLGYFILYINGQRVSDDEFVPAYSDYIPRNRENMKLAYPLSDVMDNRIYCLNYDISPFIKNGENVIGVMLGGGYFHQFDRRAEGLMDYGNIRLCYKIKNGKNEFLSDESVKYQQGFIKYSSLFYGEKHDYNGFDYNWNTDKAKDENWLTPVLCDGMENVPMYIQTAHTDKVAKTYVPVKVKDFGDYSIYDTGINTTGYVVVKCSEAGETVKLAFAENLNEDKTLNYDSAGYEHQIANDEFITDGITELLYPRLLWHGFRYFALTNNAEPVEVREIYTGAPVTSAFECSDETLNWLYNTYVHTQLCNTHSAVMTDCPHRERLGYTGDGQLCAMAGMLTIDLKETYKKWIYDIIDCQDKTTGHVQHTAPFGGGGGGPIGWGGAILTVPYYYFKQFGNTDFLKECYPFMKKFTEYIESRCENGIIVREEEKGWCLGDWCAPEKIAIPEAYVNTTMYVTQLEMLAELENALSVDNSETVALAQSHRYALKKAYLCDENGSFLGGVQGADAFACDCGIDNKNTFETLKEKYSKLGMYDTGIFGTYILTGLLFKRGAGDLAFELLSNKNEVSFEYMRKNSATTLWENWNGESSHNHPMFGASVQYLFDSILGISQAKDSYAYDKVIIAPAQIKSLDFAKGYITTVKGKISVSYKKNNGKTEFTVELPENQSAEFIYAGVTKTLTSAVNKFTI
ncbi:MAG: family 78 glycoside hydrolase catalytic domain [Clostridia bacterium]|nr:family 78 glycoside hydrolase catalytic domain [Clostridia bacterium]